MKTASHRASRALNALLLTVAGVGPAIYPAWLAWRARGLSDPVPPEIDEWPPVTVVVPAYRERLVIAEKVQNTLDNGYPGVVEVLVIAEDRATAAAAGATPARVITGRQRRGKAAALNAGVAEAKGDVVVLTDANAMIEPGGLARLVRWLQDPTVGAVTGEKRTKLGRASGEGIYWAYESWLKRHENRIGTTIGVSGELIATRRADYVPLATDTAVDDLWFALDVAAQGKRIVYEPGARVYEDEIDSARAEWERRTRIIAGAIDAILRRRRHLRPGSPIAAQVWGHRFLRSSPGPIAHGILVLRALAATRRSRLAQGFLAIHMVGAVAFATRKRRKLGLFERALAQVLFLQASGIGGTLRWARGDRPALWPKPERTMEGRETVKPKR